MDELRTASNFSWLRHLILPSLVILIGCNQNKIASQAEKQAAQSANTVETPVADGPSASEILNQVVQKYRSSNSYQDEAVLYLNYRLHGQVMQEPQPWAVKWTDDQLAANLFNGKILADGHLLSCYVFDIDSGNLDNQHLLIPYDDQLPIRQLFRDGIARHFVGGFSELPLDESDQASLPQLIPPTIALLTGHPQNLWFHDPDKAQRLPDATLEETPCFVVRSLANQMTCDCLIRKSDFALVRISLPLKLLAGEVITSPEVTDVELVANFHKATFDVPISTDVFAIQERKGSSPVRKFVPVPEVFPSELIGKTAPEFQLIVPNGRARTRLFFDGKVTAFLWMAGEGSYKSMLELDKIAKSYAPEKFHLAAVYSDSELKEPRANSFVAEPELEEQIRQVDIPVYYDRHLETSTRLKVQTVPSLLVMDGDSKIQFSRSLADDGWKKELVAVLDRVAQGDDVATEMQREYQQFIDSYHQQLSTLSAANLINSGSTNIQAVSHRQQPIRVRPAKSWTNATLKQPGNIYFVDDANPRYVLFDGWRTIVELDMNGKPAKRQELSLPPGVAVNLARVGVRDSETFWALFSVQSSQVFLFDSDWSPVGAIPQSKDSRTKILDCQFLDLNGDNESELVIAYDGTRGVELVDIQSLESESIGKMGPDSLCAFGEDIVVAADGRLGRLQTREILEPSTELSFQTIANSSLDQLCALGMARTGAWTAIGLNESLKRTWAIPVGPQFYEKQIEAVVSTVSRSGEIIWAIADSENVIHLVSGSGKWLGDFQSDSELSGIELSTSSRSTSLVVANEEGVVCWDLQLESAFSQASFRE